MQKIIIISDALGFYPESAYSLKNKKSWCLQAPLTFWLEYYSLHE